MKPKPPLPPKPTVRALPLLMFAGGLAAAMYYGHHWYRLPVYTEGDIAESVALNLAMDLQRRDAAFRADPTAIDGLRQQIDGEVRAAITSEREETMSYTGTGLILMAIGLAQMLILRRTTAR
jgi:hypothetical protein